jgi:hypothetical protein
LFLLPSLQATIAVMPPVEVTAALTSATVVMHAGHITRLPGFSFILRSVSAIT